MDLFSALRRIDLKSEVIMRAKSVLLTLGLMLSPVALSACPPLLDHTFRALGKTDEIHLCTAYQGKLLLVVNTASKCAFTPQYEGLETLNRDYQGRGLVVLGFPSNDFFGQEPGTEQQISDFCRLTYNVDFPMFEKTQVSRDNAVPFYRALAEAAGEYPSWNFHKYLIAPDGTLVGSFSSFVSPQSDRLVRAIEAHLPN